jgi:hypothetical protein
VRAQVEFSLGLHNTSVMLHTCFKEIEYFLTCTKYLIALTPYRLPEAEQLKRAGVCTSQRLITRLNHLLAEMCLHDGFDILRVRLWVEGESEVRQQHLCEQGLFVKAEGPGLLICKIGAVKPCAQASDMNRLKTEER